MMQTDIQKIWAIHANKALQAHIMKRRMGRGSQWTIFRLLISHSLSLRIMTSSYEVEGCAVFVEKHHKDARVYILALRLEASLKWKRVRMTWHVVKRPFGDSDSPISLDNGHPSLYVVRGCAR
jgi:hypothetical protein